MIVVTGATGFVGHHVVRELLTEGHAVRVITRSGKAGDLWPRVEAVKGDVQKPGPWQDALAGADAVIHLVGIIVETGDVTYQSAHIEATRNVLAACRTYGIHRYLHMSALGTRPFARSGYHQSKWEAEELVRASGLEWTIFRPSLIYGPGDHFINMFVSFLRFPLDILQADTLPNVGGGHTLVQPVAVEDVARAFARSIAQPEAFDRVFVLSGPQPMPMRNVLLIVATTMGRRPVIEDFPTQYILRHLLWTVALALPVAAGFAWFLGAGSGVLIVIGVLWAAAVAGVAYWRNTIIYTVPWPVAFAAGWFLGLFRRWIKPPVTVDQMLMLQEDNAGDSTPARELFLLGHAGLAEGIRKYVPHPPSHAEHA